MGGKVTEMGTFTTRWTGLKGAYFAHNACLHAHPCEVVRGKASAWVYNISMCILAIIGRSRALSLVLVD